MLIPKPLLAGLQVQRIINVFGTALVPAGDFQDLWLPIGRMFYFTDNRQVQIVSSSAQDNPAGTGAYEVMVEYIDEDYIEKSVVLTMNGTTPVLFPIADVMRVNNMCVMQANDDGTGRFRNIGNITVTDTLTAELMDFMLGGYNCSASALYTVPDGFYGLIDYSYIETSEAGQMQGVLVSQEPGQVFQIDWPFFLYQSQSHREMYAIHPPRTNYAIKVQAIGGALLAQGGFRMNLIKQNVVERYFKDMGFSIP